jgi:MoaA/NifB/PqqE/SkfB family radical SAM enzyme
MDSLAACLSKFKFNEKVIILSPLIFIRCFSQQCGYLVYFIMQRAMKRHKNRSEAAKLLFYNLHKKRLKTPAYLVLFVTNNCNASCLHCFYWERMLERRGREKEMTMVEYESLSRQLGFVEKLSLTGGEPFLRDDLHMIAALFCRNNYVKEIGITTNGILSNKIFDTARMILELCPDVKLGICLGVDGLEKTHDRLRGVDGAFGSVINSYNMLKGLKDKYSRFSVSLNFTLTNSNQDDFIPLYDFVKQYMPECWPLTFSLLRKAAGDGAIIGKARTPELEVPDLDKIKSLAKMILKDLKKENKPSFDSALNEVYFGHILSILINKKQGIPCLAADIYAVIDEIANVYFCDYRSRIGNLRKNGFREIWLSDEAKSQRAKIKSRECFCYHSFFQDLNIKYQLCNPKILGKILQDYRI